MKNSSSNFFLYELLRILIPGFYCIFIIYVYDILFAIPIFPFSIPEMGFAAFFIGGIIAGLSLYALESSKKRKAFQDNQPSQYLLERSRILNISPVLSEDDARRLYYYILNHYMPFAVHDKIFFFGMVYHIMTSIRRTSFWFGILGIIGIIICAFMQHDIFSSVIIVLLLWLIYGINVRYNKADRKMQENYQDQIFWLQMNKELVDTLITQRTHIDNDTPRNLP